MYNAKAYYELGRRLAQEVRRGASPGDVCRAAAAELGQSVIYCQRALGFYRLFCEALGFGPEVFALGPRRLAHLRSVIDWNSRQNTVGNGFRGKWSRDTALRRIRRMLEERGRLHRGEGDDVHTGDR